jgi:SH3 domain-containing YSC84-like protein 1
VRGWQWLPRQSDGSDTGTPKANARNQRVTLRVEILSYSRSRGLLVGISLEGSTIRPDKNPNKELYDKALYDKGLSAKDIVLKGAVPGPPSAQELLSTLSSKTPKAKAAG